MVLLEAIRPAYAVSGFVVGLLVGLTGVGGGSLMTPLLVLVFGIHPAMAVGTDLLYAGCTKAVGTAIHGASRTVDWRIVGRLALGSVPATVATVLVLSWVGLPGPGVGHVISIVLAVALVLTAISLVFRQAILKWAQARGARGEPRHAAALTVLTGAVLGVLVSVSSVGAGALGVTVLLLLYPNLRLRQIVGADIAHAVPLTLIAGFGHWMAGGVDWHLFGSLLTGSVPGIILGSLLAARISERVLRPVLAVVLALASFKLFQR